MGQQLLTSQSPSVPLFDNPWMMSECSLDQHNDQNPLNAQNLLTPKPNNSLEGGSGWSFDGMTSSILGPSMTPFERLASPTLALSFNSIEDYQLVTSKPQSSPWVAPLDDFWNLTRFNADDCSSGFLQWSPSKTSPLYLQESSIETDISLPSSSAIGSGRLSVFGQQSFGLRNQWLQSLPSAKLEAFLGDQSMTWTSKSNSVLKTSLSGILTLMSLSNILNKSVETTAGHVNQVKTTFQMLSDLIPSTAGAVISEQQITDTSIIKMMFLSIMNGFAGMNHLPIDSLLPCLRRLGIFKPLFQQCLLGPRSPAKRSFIDSLFKASIYAEDEEMVHMILQHNLVDVNNTTYVCEGRRCTPVEKAASLRALNIIRILANHGAGVNPIDLYPIHPHYDGNCHGALELLLCTFTRPAPEDPSLELLNTIRLLVAKGCKVRARRLNDIAKSFPTDEVLSLLSQAISLADHRKFFERQPQPFGRAEMIETATLPEENTSLSIMRNMIKFCQSHGGSCFAEFADVTEEAAVEAARRGRLEVIELIIEYAKSTDLILSAAISSRNPDLVQFLLSCKPNLNPPARSYRHELLGDGFEREIDQCIPTTPFAEAIRTGDSELIRLLESAGCGTFCSLTDHGRLEAAILAVVEGADIPRLRRLLSIASLTKVKLRLSRRALSLALIHGHEGVAQILIEYGTQLDLQVLDIALNKRNSRIVAAILATDLSPDFQYCSPTKAALEWADPSMLQSLLYIMPDISLSSRRYEPLDATMAEFCLHCMDSNNFDLFRFFVESTSDPKKDWNGCLAMAVRKGHRTMASYLLQKGANLSHPSVIAAAIPDRPDMLSFLFGNAMQDWKQASSPQKCVGAQVLLSLMTEDTESAEAKVLDQLLEIGAVNLVVPERITTEEPKEYFSTCVTPLGLAILGKSNCCNTNLSAINKFLKAGADPNGLARLETVPYRRVTALMAALETGRRDIVSLVIDRGADVNLQPHLSLRRTPLQYAAELGDLDMIRLLLEHGADVNSPPAFQGGGTALQFAAISGNCNIIAELLEHGASLDIPPSKIDGRWPLEGAAEHGRLDMIQLLWNARELSPGNVGFAKRQCLRAMDFARENQHSGCQDLVAELSGLSVEMLDTEDYGVPWLAY